MVSLSQVACAWAGKPQKIMSIPLTPKEEPVAFKLGEAVGSAKEPVTCFKTVAAACKAKWLQRPLKDGHALPRGTTRMVLLFQVGVAGEGKDSIATDANGQQRCTSVVPLALCPLPAELAAGCQPVAGFWVPGGGVHALG